MNKFDDENEPVTVEFDLFEKDLPCYIVGHTTSEFPMRIAEKKFEAHYFCTKCGAILEQHGKDEFGF